MRMQVPPDIQGRQAGSVYPWSTSGARQDLSAAQNGAIAGAHGGQQQLGPAALARLRATGGGDQTPGIVPSLPGGQDMPSPSPGGWRSLGGPGPAGPTDSYTAPGGGEEGNPDLNSWETARLGQGPRTPQGPNEPAPVESPGAGPQRFGAPPQSVDSFTMPPQQLGGPGPNVPTDSAMSPGPYGISPSSSAPFPALQPAVADRNNVQQPSASSFPLVQQALQKLVANEPPQNPGSVQPGLNAPGGGVSPGAPRTPSPMIGGGLFAPGINPVLAQIRQRMRGARLGGIQTKPLGGPPSQIAGGAGGGQIAAQY